MTPLAAFGGFKARLDAVWLSGFWNLWWMWATLECALPLDLPLQEPLCAFVCLKLSTHALTCTQQYAMCMHAPLNKHACTLHCARMHTPMCAGANLWGLRRLGAADLPNQGLDGLISYASNIGRQTRYSAAHGFLYAISDAWEPYRMVVSDSALSATAVHAGGITLRNAPGFDPLTTLPTTSRATVTLLPSCMLPMAVLVKTARPDGQTLFNIGIEAPSAATGPIDASLWFKAAYSTSSSSAASGGAAAEAGAGKGLGVLGRRRQQRAVDDEADFLRLGWARLD